MSILAQMDAEADRQADQEMMQLTTNPLFMHETKMLEKRLATLQSTMSATEDGVEPGGPPSVQFNAGPASAVRPGERIYPLQPTDARTFPGRPEL